MSEDVTTKTPVDQIFRTSDRDPGACREQVIGVALLDDARVMDLTDVPFRLLSDQQAKHQHSLRRTEFVMKHI
jgi:hypothetical protein